MFEAAISWFLGMGATAFFVAGTLAPLETMTWWAGHHAVPRRWRRHQGALSANSPVHYIVYLGGIDSVDGRVHTPYERPLLEALKSKLGGVGRIVTVFPYAASGTALLGGARFFRWLWRALERMRATRPSVLTSLINARNFFQLLVSADRRYGPIFNDALASLILEALQDAGWSARQPPQRLTMIGYSGGAQMAIGAAAFLARRWRGPIGVISIGGTIIAPAGLDYVDRFDHLTGDDDLALRASVLMCAARWPIALRSPWRRAKRDGRLHIVQLGHIGHTGAHGYLGQATQPGAFKSNFAITLDATLASLTRPLPPRARRGRFAQRPPNLEARTAAEQTDRMP